MKRWRKWLRHHAGLVAGGGYVLNAQEGLNSVCEPTNSFRFPYHVEGLCGTCIVDVLAGEPDHRDLVLDDEEKQSNTLITVCCSRAKSARLKLDL